MKRKYDYSRFRELYDTGMSDKDIGAALGIPRHNIMCHRYYLGLSVNNVKIKYNYTKAKKLYDRGYRDTDICKILGIPPESFSSWRKNRNLPANNPPKCVVARHDWKDLSKMINETDKDKDSLFCDGDFLEQLLQKPIERLGKERQIS